MCFGEEAGSRAPLGSPDWEGVLWHTADIETIMLEVGWEPQEMRLQLLPSAPPTACPAPGFGLGEAESSLVQKTITAKSPKRDPMSETAKELILCCKNVIWKLLLLNNCRLLMYWIHFTNPELTFLLETKPRTKTACVKPNCFKPSCRCLHHAHFWKESTKAGK